MKYTLSVPIVHEGTTYSEINFREAETGDMMTADRFDGQTSKVVAILACMAEMPLDAFRKIKMRDLNNIMVQTASLMGEPQPVTTGA